MIGDQASYQAAQYDAMVKHAYGYVDPEHAARGVPHDNMPTMIAHYRTTMEIPLTTFAPLWDPYVNGGVVNSDVPYMMSPTNSIALLISPQIDNTSSPTPSPAGYRPAGCMGTGWTLDPAMPLGGGYTAGGSTTLYGKPCPLPPFPLMPPQTGAPPLANPQIVSNPARFRCVGLRTTLQVCTPQIWATGDVLAGDNCDYMEDDPGFYTSTTGATQFVGDAPFDSQANLLTTPSLAPVGQTLNRNEATFESVWLPGNGSLSNYRQVLQSGTTISYDPAGPSYNGSAAVFTWNLRNSPCNIFVIRGLPANTTTSLRVSIVMAVEVPVAPNMSWGLLMKEARMVQNFVMDYQLLDCMQSGGLAGDALRCLLASCEQGKKGLMMAVQGIAAPATRQIMQTQQGPKSSTSLVVQGAETAGGAAVAQALMSSRGRTGIANLARAGARRAASVGRVAARLAGRYGGRLVGFAEEAAPLAIAAL